MMVIIRQTIVSSYNTDSIYLKTINGHESILVVGCCVGVVEEVINHIVRNMNTMTVQGSMRMVISPEEEHLAGTISIPEYICSAYY